MIIFLDLTLNLSGCVVVAKEKRSKYVCWAFSRLQLSSILRAFLPLGQRMTYSFVTFIQMLKKIRALVSGDTTRHRY